MAVMVPNNDKISRRQLITLGILCLMSSLIRHVPGIGVSLAGGGLWLSILIAAVLITALFFVLRAFMSAGNGKSVFELFCCALGRPLGKATVFIFGAWFIFYSAFVLRSGADRFVGTIYSDSSPGIFIVVMLIACLAPAMGQLKSISRSAMLMWPVLFFVLLLIFIFALPSAELQGLWQINTDEFKEILLASLSVINPMCIISYLVFVCDRSDGHISFAQFSQWLIVSVLSAELLYLTVVGVFGTEITAKLNNPFFVLVRNISFFGSIERVEAIIIAVWVFSDFVLVSLLLWMAARCMRFILGFPYPDKKPEPFDMSNGRWLTPLCAAAALICALTMAGDSMQLMKYTQEIMPILNISLAFFILPGILVVGRLRKKF